MFYNPPYTNDGIEKASANLLDFAKTDMLEPGASQTVTFTLNREEMASFDNKSAGCYVLETGNYTISINSDSHNIIDSQVYTVDTAVVYNKSNARST